MLLAWLKAMRVGWLAYQMYRAIGESGSTYAAFTWRGVPHTTLLLGKGREAWVISDFAANVKGQRHGL